MTSQFTFLKPAAATSIAEGAAEDVRDLLPFPIPALFNGGARGEYFVADRGNLFQDRAGTTPVTAVGQPVRSIRGNIYNTLAAVDLDTYFWNYTETAGIGLLQCNAASRGFSIPRSAFTPNDLLYQGGQAQFLLAGVIGNITSLNFGTFFSTSGGWLDYSFSRRADFDYGGGTYPGTPGNYTVIEWNTDNHNIEGSPTAVVTSVRSLVARNPDGWRVLRETTPRNNSPLRFDHYPGPSLARTRLQYADTPYLGPTGPDIDLAQGNTTGTVYVFGTDITLTGIANQTRRSALIVGKAVDPALHQHILDAL